MAEIADIYLLPLEEDEDEDEDESSQYELDFESETLDPTPFFSSSVFGDETLIPPIFSPEPHLQSSDHDDQITLSLDFFDHSPPPETLDTSDYLGLGLGLGFDIQEEEEDRSMDQGDGLRVVGFGSDSDSEVDPNSHDQDPSLPLCWDSLRLEEERRGFDEDFEWEEVDGCLDERDFLSMMVGERSRSSEHDEDEEEVRNADWELLLSVSNVVVEDGDYVNPSEYEITFEQFVDNDSAIRVIPPAAKSVVESLPLIVLTREDAAKNNAICAVCKDEILLEEKVRQLPCLHHYHGECILPWLGMRNTCPVCRYELPTDDREYESWKAQEG